MYDKLIDEIKESNLEVYGIEIFRNEKTVFRHMFKPDIRYNIYSAVKSITSAAVGIAQDEGKFDIQRPIVSYLPEQYDFPENFRKLSVERFLTMSVKGLPFRPEGEDWIENILSLSVDYSAPPEFSYSNISAYLVGIACENAVQEKLIDYIGRKIFQPLGIETPEYQTDPQGRFYGATGMKLTVHELSLIGQLYLQNGKSGNVQIIPENWVRASVSRHIENSDGGYGYFFWTKGNSFRISGKWGQKCLVYPEKDLLITYMGNMPENAGKMLDIAERFSKSEESDAE